MRYFIENVAVYAVCYMRHYMDDSEHLCAYLLCAVYWGTFLDNLPICMHFSVSNFHVVYTPKETHI